MYGWKIGYSRTRNKSEIEIIILNNSHFLCSCLPMYYIFSFCIVWLMVWPVYLPFGITL